MATTLKQGDSFSLYPVYNGSGYNSATLTIPVSGQKVDINISMSGYNGWYATASSGVMIYSTANGGAAANASGNIYGVTSNIVLTIHANTEGYTQGTSSSEGRGGAGAYLAIGGSTVVQCGGGGGGKVNFNSGKPEQVTSTIDGYNSTDTSHSRNSGGDGSLLIAGQSFISYPSGVTGDVSLSDWGSGSIYVSITNALNYTPYITSFTSPASVAAGNSIGVNWAGVQEVVNGTLTFDLDYTLDGGTTWTNLLTSSTATSYSLATPVVSANKTYQFRVIAKNSGYTGNYYYVSTSLTGNLKLDDANTVSLIHFDATTDELGYLLLPYGGAQIDTVNGGLPCGVNKYVVCKTPKMFSKDFTVEGFVTLTDVSLTWMAGLFSTLYSGSTGISFCFYYGKPAIYLNGNSILTHTTILTAGTKTHISYGRSGTTWYISVGGVIVSTTNTATINNDASFAQIGHFWNSNFTDGSSLTYYLRGTHYGVKISNVCKYTANFTPPTFLSADATTVFFTKFDKPLYTGLEDMSGKTWTSVNAALKGVESSGVFGGNALELIQPAKVVQFNAGTISGDFTVECFAYYKSGIGSRNARAFTSNRGAGNRVEFFAIMSSDGTTASLSTEGLYTSNNMGGISLNNWHHLAISRSSGTLRFFLDGAIIASTTNTDTVDLSNFILGNTGTSGNTTDYMYGYLDEFRISNSARYTANFSIPTSKFSTDANTIFLSHFETPLKTGLEDEMNIVWESNGGISVNNTNLARFGSTGLTFDGGNDYLTHSTLLPNSSDFTCEGFFYVKDTTTYPTIFSTRTGGSNGIFLEASGTDNRLILSVGNGSLLFQSFSTLTFTRNAWHHFAVCRSGSNFYAFVDGTLYCSGSSSSSITNQTHCFGYDLGNQTAQVFFAGNMDEIRISNIARYTANFTPPTSAFTPDANTISLMHFDVTTDETGKSLIPYGGCNIAATAVKMGTSSLYLASGSVITTPYTADFAFPADFTIECFIYPTAYASPYGSNIFTRCWPGTNFIQFWMDTSGIPSLCLNGSSVTNSVKSIATLNKWHHIAACRSGSTVYLFLDGILQGTMTCSTDLTNSNTQAVCIGGYSHNTSQMPFIGYIDEFRVAKGKAWYTSNFSPPSNPFGYSLLGFYRYII